MSQNKLETTIEEKIIRLSSILRELRFAEGKSQQEFAEILDIHRNTVSNAENGRNITLLTLLAYSESTGIPLSEIFECVE